MRNRIKLIQEEVKMVGLGGESVLSEQEKTQLARCINALCHRENLSKATTSYCNETFLQD